jgi:hypothetical protein
MQPVLGGTPASVPHWSPDGTLLALQTPASGCPPCSSTTILNPDTGQTRVLPPADPTLAQSCSLWSSDATHFACDLENVDGSANGLYTIRTSDGGGMTRITNAGAQADIPIDYSPDGKQSSSGASMPTTTAARPRRHCSSARVVR